MRAAVLTLSLSLALAACGGGGGAGSTPPAPGPSPTGICASGAAFVVSADTSVDVGKTATAMVAGCAGAISSPVWAQTSGPAVSLLSAKSQAISFDAAAAGTYGFQVSFRDPAGVQQTVPVSITAAAPASPSAVTVRGEPSVFSGGSTSFRMWIPAGVSVSSVRWEQTEGPAVTLNTEDPQRIIFAAPSVGQDTRLTFRATVTLTTGATDSDTQTLLVQALPTPPAGQLFGSSNPASRVYPYRATSPWATQLSNCVYSPALFFNGGTTNLCTMNTLPLLGQETNGAQPTVDQVMNRVLVSNDWMGEVFERFLREQDTAGDFRQMLKATTAIVIGGRVRPSFYWSATGAIYLDANTVWLDAAQRDTVSEVPDPRSALAPNLQYLGLWRYTLNNQQVPFSVPLNSRGARPIEQLRYRLGELLYHELTHANDFMPPAVHLTVNRGVPVFQAIPASLPSDRLAASFPLASQEMFGLARSKFFSPGTTTDLQNAYTPLQVGGTFFANDRATDEYNYAIPPGSTPQTSREDIAMLVAEFFMSYRYGVLRDVGFTNKPAVINSGNDLIVAWGQRGRAGAANIKPRVQQAIGEIAPWLPAGAANTLPAPIQMRAGESWTANTVLPTVPGGSFKLTQLEDFIERDRVEFEWMLNNRNYGHGHWIPPDLRQIQGGLR
ncbi:hypothetical protein [Piscinibacterium candidicorallinum]|uniref:Lipoprotein n=1 Tax=Piscinibacterium candidicorallinum TaxID=1793872 RepID=A0ABV7H6U0_9BURK